MDSAPDLLIFKMRGIATQETKGPEKQEKQPESETPIAYLEPGVQEAAAKGKQVVMPSLKSTPKPEPSSIYYKEGGDYPNPMNFYKEAIEQNEEVQTAPLMTAPKSRADSREKAKGLFCSTHRFRHAYAICAYCHRPFCYEDIAEYQNEYYCVEDVDRVTSHYTETLANEYSFSNLLASFILIGGFILYFYYSNGQLGYVFSFLVKNPAGFISSINIAYGLILSSLTIMVFTMIGALYILMGSKRGHIAAAVLSAAAVAVMLFTYEYISSGSIYLVIIAGFEFAAFLAIIHSAASEARTYNQVFERGPEYNLAYGFKARF
jgi:hypothetical protein